MSKHPGGRPSIYNDKLGKLICDRIAVHDCGLNKLCAMYDDMPAAITINEWRDKHAEFALRYATAKQKQIETIIAEMLDIADDNSGDTRLNSDGTVNFNHEYMARARLRIDTRKWLAAKLAPKIYGDKLQTETKITVKHEDALAELE